MKNDDQVKELLDKLTNEVVPYTKEMYVSLQEYEEHISNPDQDLSEKHIQLLKAAEEASLKQNQMMNEIQELRGGEPIRMVGGTPYSRFVEKNPVLEMVEEKSKIDDKSKEKSM